MNSSNSSRVVFVVFGLLALGVLLWTFLGTEEKNQQIFEAAKTVQVSATQESITKTETTQAVPPTNEGEIRPDPARQEYSTSFAHKIRGRLTVIGKFPFPLAAKITAEFTEDKSQYSANANPDGSFEIALPKLPQAAKFTIDSDYHYLEKPFLAAADESGSFPELVIPLKVGGKIEGTVRLPNGSNAEHVIVLLGQVSEGMWMGMGAQKAPTKRKVESDAQGSFVIKGIPIGSKYLLRSSLSGYAPILLKDLRVEALKTTQFHWQLDLESSISGVVQNEKNETIAGAKVVVVPWGGFSEFAEFGIFQEEMKAEFMTDSAADGSFRFGSLSFGRFKIIASKAGLKEQMSEVIALKTGESVNDVKLVLHAGNQIRGIVLDRAGQPIANAKVSAGPDYYSGGGVQFRFSFFAGESLPETKTDHEGKFVLEGFADELFVVNASLEGVGQVSKNRVKPGGDDLELRLLPYGSISGTVRVASLNAPISKFQIETFRLEQGMIPVAVKSEFFQSKDGQYELSGLVPGSLTVVAKAEGFCAVKQKIEIEEGKTATLDFSLPLAALVRGRVLMNGSLDPVAGAQISPSGGNPATWWLDRMDTSIPRTQTDAEGNFSLSGLSAGSHTIQVEHPEFATAKVGPFELAAGYLKDGVEILLKGGGGIEGFFYADGGQPISGGNITVFNVQAGMFKNAQTDTSGHFSIPRGLAEGKYQVMGMPALADASEKDEMQESMMQGMKIVFVDVKDGEIVQAILGEKNASGCRLHGRVLAGGSPVSSAYISITPKANAEAEKQTDLKFTSSDKEGKYSLENLKPGHISLTIQRNDGSSGMGSSITVETEIPDRAEYQFDIQLPGGSIAGRIVDAKTGLPIVDISVTLSLTPGSTPSGSKGSQFGQLKTDAEGRYRFRDLAPGSYMITAAGGIFWGKDSRGYGRIAREASLGGEHAVDGIDFSLRPGGKIEGRITSSGAPLAGASVFFQDRSGQTLNSYSDVVSDASGNFVYEGLASGEYAVIAKARGYAPSRREAVLVQEAQTSSVVLDLLTGTQVTVKLLNNLDSKAIVGASVQVFDEKGRSLTGLVGYAEMVETWSEGVQAGSYPAGSLAPGNYRVVISHANYQLFDQTIRIDNQQTQVVELKLIPNGN